jgi:hypothetical protein
MSTPTYARFNVSMIPRVCKPTTVGGRSVSMLAPLAGVAAQDATPYVSEWLPVGPGAFLQLALNLEKLVGTLSIILETVGDPAKEKPRFCGSFAQTNTPGEVHANMMSDAYVRVVATPGTGPDQAAHWSITGNAFVPFVGM